MLYAVHLFPENHTVNLNWNRTSCEPDIKNIADSGSALAWQDYSALSAYCRGG